MAMASGYVNELSVYWGFGEINMITSRQKWHGKIEFSIPAA